MRATTRKVKRDAGRDRMSSRAVALFDSGYQCAESVVTSAKERLGLRSSVVPSVATGFGAGIGRKGSVCGALTGAIMGIGLAYGRQKPSQDREKAYALARKTFDKFKARFGSPYCMELIRVDLNTKSGMDKYHRLNMHTLKCARFVEAGAGILEQEMARERKATRKAARKAAPRAQRKAARKAAPRASRKHSHKR